MPVAAFDHLIVAAATLEQGEEFIESQLGARPQRGGRHVAMGTHNSLLKVGPRAYLEVIAIDPDGAAPARARWFELDRPEMQTQLRAAPRLIHWAASTGDIDATRRACTIDPGPAHAMSRGGFNWRITIPEDGHLPGGGVLPTLVAWPDERHPTDTMPDARIRLASIAASHPEPARIRGALAALGLAETLQVTFAVKARLAAMLHTPRGTVTL
jgi:Glyoxalase-like domain